MATTYLTDATPETTASSTTRAQLRWQNAAGETHTLVLANGPTTIGGGPRCAVQLDPAEALPLQCVIQCDEEDVTVRRWANGAVLNGRPFTESLLRPGDTLTVAGVEIEVESVTVDFAATPVSPVAASFDLHTESSSPATSTENDRLQTALQTTRGRVRSVLAALRDERTAGQQAQSSLAQTTANRDELATKLLMVTTELHDCRTELEQVRANFETATGDQNDHRRLYEMAQEEIDELEQQVASLRSEHDALLAEQTEWSTQREQLESAIVALESRINQPEFDEPQADEPTVEPTNEQQEAETFEQPTIEVEAANVDTDVNQLSWEVAPATEAAHEVEINEENRSDQPADNFTWGIETPATDEQPASAPALQDPTEQQPADNLWAGTWGVAGNEPVNENSDATPETSSDEQPAESTSDWLTSFNSEPETPAADAPKLVEETIEEVVEDTVEETVAEPAPYEAPETDALIPASETLLNPTSQIPSEAEEVFVQPEPESVEDLIADEQPSSEAPVSFIDQFADKLPADEFPAVESPVDEAQVPAMVEPIAEAPQAEPMPQEEGEESIEDYMAKLMQRMRGNEDPSPTSAAPMAALASSVNTAETLVAPPQAETPPQLVTPLTNLDELRSGPAPEQGHDMSSLRALANHTARDAIGVSEVNQDRTEANLHLAISGIAMVCSAFLAVTTPSWTDWTLLVGVVGFAWAAFWFSRTWKLRKSIQQKEATRRESEAMLSADVAPSEEV